MLVHYNPDESLELRADACDHAICGILIQKSDNGTGVLHYVSYILNNGEKKYSIIKKNFLAVVYCIHKLRIYLV